LATLPLYPPPLIRVGEDVKKRGEAPLKHPFPARSDFAEDIQTKGIGYRLT